MEALSKQNIKIIHLFSEYDFFLNQFQITSMLLFRNETEFEPQSQPIHDLFTTLYCGKI